MATQKSVTKRVTFSLIIVSITVFFQFGMENIVTAAPRGVIKTGIHWGVSAESLDPATCSYLVSAQFPLYLFHDALVKPMPEGLHTPCLAESWTVTPDGRVFEFKLRKGVKFHNGEIMTAEDVVFSFWRYQSSNGKMIHDKTEKVEIVNPYTVRFHFKEGFPDFLDYFAPGASSIGWVVPKKYVEKVGVAGFKRHPIGAGPYKFVEFSAGTNLIGEAFEDFWKKVPHIKRLEFHTIPEPATRLTMVKRGEVDVATYFTGVFHEDLKKTASLRLLSVISPLIQGLFMTAQWDSKSPWSHPNVRLAASLAIDRKTLAEVFQPGGGPVGSIALEGDPLMVTLAPHPYDPERAKKLLAEAGYPKGFHGGKLPLMGAWWEYGEQIATYLKAVGIDLDLVLLEKAAWSAARDSGKMKGNVIIDAAMAPTIGGRLSYLFGPASYGNYPDIQALWERCQRESTPKVRDDLIGQIQKLIYERNMWIPLTSTCSSYAIRQGTVKGNPYRIQPYLFHTAPYEDMELEK